MTPAARRHGEMVPVCACAPPAVTAPAPCRCQARAQSRLRCVRVRPVHLANHLRCVASADDGVEYMTPPHTPLRGIGVAHELDVGTQQRAVQGACTVGGARMQLNLAGPEAHGDLVAIAPGRGRPGLGKAPLQQRVTFAAHRLAGGSGYVDTPPSSPPAMTGGNGAACAAMLLSQSLATTQEFNRSLAMVSRSGVLNKERRR
jgi:hypothetical protein